MSLMRKPTICIGENKDADQHLCFRYTDSTLPLLPKSEISSFWPASVLVQLGLCQTCSETTLLVFPRGSSYVDVLSEYFLVYSNVAIDPTIFFHHCILHLQKLVVASFIMHHVLGVAKEVARNLSLSLKLQVSNHI